MFDFEFEEFFDINLILRLFSSESMMIKHLSVLIFLALIWHEKRFSFYLSIISSNGCIFDLNLFKISK